MIVTLYGLPGVWDGNAGEGHGRIINLASLNTFVSVQEVSTYATSKAAMGALTKSLAVDWGRLFRWEGNESIDAGVGRSFGWRTGDGGVRASGKLEIASARAEDHVRIVEGIGVWRIRVRTVRKEDSVEVNLRAMVMIVAIEEDLAASRDAHVTQRDVAEGGG